MKNPPILTIGKRAFEILDYISHKEFVITSEIYKEFKLNGNGIFLKNLKDKDLIKKVSRGKYQITDIGRDLLKIIKEMKRDETI